MKLDHRELRWALVRFLAARRDLHQAYRKCGATHDHDKSIPILEWRAADQAGNDSVMSEELQNLKDENERLRKSLALLHTYSLRVSEQHDTLLVQRDKLLDTCEAAASRVRDGYRADEYSTHLREQLEDAIGEFPRQKYA